MTMSREEIKAIAQEAGEAGAKSALKVTFQLLGVDIENVEHVNDFRANLDHARRWRKLIEAAGRKAFLTVVGAAAILGAVILFDYLFPGHRR